MKLVIVALILAQLIVCIEVNQIKSVNDINNIGRDSAGTACEREENTDFDLEGIEVLSHTSRVNPVTANTRTQIPSAATYNKVEEDAEILHYYNGLINEVLREGAPISEAVNFFGNLTLEEIEECNRTPVPEENQNAIEQQHSQQIHQQKMPVMQGQQSSYPNLYRLLHSQELIQNEDRFFRDIDGNKPPNTDDVYRFAVHRYSNSVTPKIHNQNHYIPKQEVPMCSRTSGLKHHLPEEKTSAESNHTAKRAKKDFNSSVVESDYMPLRNKAPSTALFGKVDTTLSAEEGSNHNLKTQMHFGPNQSFRLQANPQTAFSAVSEKFLRRWRLSTLEDSKRIALRSIDNLILYKTAGEDELRKTEVERIETLARYINSCARGAHIWNVVLKLPGQKENRHADFLILHNNKKNFDEKLRQFAKYYDGFFKDLAKYMKKYTPTAYTKEEDAIKLSPPSYVQTLGDVYVRNSLDTKSLQACIDMKKKTTKYSAFKNKILVILDIPEICRDLLCMPLDVFTQILESIEEGEKGNPKNDDTARRIIIVRVLYKTLHTAGYLNRGAGYNFLFADLLKEFTKMAEKDDKKIDTYTTEEVYMETYSAVSLFYRYAPYYYKMPQDPARLQRLIGKEIIVEQEYIKCEAVVNTGDSIDVGIRPKLERINYSTVVNHWNVVQDALCVPQHYHVQFVDNALQTVKRVCIPLYKEKDTKNCCYVHTIAQIIEYLKEIHTIEKVENIYAMKVEQRASMWSLVLESDKAKSIDDFAKEQCSVVFYYIEEGLDNTPKFTLSLFDRPYFLKKDTIQLPLFLSPFMQCAMELGPYIEQGQHRAVKKEDLEKGSVQPSVYNYIEPKGDNPSENMRFSQIQKYYAEFYLDACITSAKDLCYSMCASVERLNDTQHKLTWYARTPKNSEEYAHYLFSPKKTDKKVLDSQTIQKVLEILENRSDSTDTFLYGFYTVEQNSKNSEVFFCQKLAKEIGRKNISKIVHNTRTSLIAFKNINCAKTELCIHNELLRMLLSSDL